MFSTLDRIFFNRSKHAQKSYYNYRNEPKIDKEKVQLN